MATQEERKWVASLAVINVFVTKLLTKKYELRGYYNP